MAHPSRQLAQARRAFTLVDVLVSVGVMALLIGLLLPSLSSVRETARRVACGSNMRQLGIGVQLFADDNRDQLPPTVRSEWYRYQFRGDKAAAEGEVGEIMTLRFSSEKLGLRGSKGWDGLGFLFAGSHITAPGVFYCPSHSGTFRSVDLIGDWSREDTRLVGNYNLRLEYDVPTGHYVRLSALNSRVALVTDGFNSADTVNHIDGTNVLRADGSVKWFADRTGGLAPALNRAAFAAPGGGGQGAGDPASEVPLDIWRDIDQTAGRARGPLGF